MKGLELARGYFLEYGKPMLERDFPELLPSLCVGLIGSGSECYGFDDELSHDHDFEPGFCIFLPENIDNRTAFLLSRAYDKLPQEYKGYKRQSINPVGGSRHGVIRTKEFFADRLGKADGRLSLYDWLTLPEQSLFEAVSGEVFLDNLGEVSEIRKIVAYYPEEIRIKKLAGRLLLAAQAGQYNYPRLISRGDSAAAQLASIEFAKNAMSAVFLINGRYMPYYKWSFRAMRELSLLSELSEPLEYLISSGNTPQEAAKKKELIEGISVKLAAALNAKSTELEQLSYEINDRITDGELRNMHILSAV